MGVYTSIAKLCFALLTQNSFMTYIKFRLDCRIPGHLICVLKCCSRSPALTKLTSKLNINISKYPSICRSLSLNIIIIRLRECGTVGAVVLYLSYFYYYSTSGVQDCRRAIVLHPFYVNYYSTSGVQDCQRAIVLYSSYFYCYSTSRVQDCGSNSFILVLLLLLFDFESAVLWEQ